MGDEDSQDGRSAALIANQPQVPQRASLPAIPNEFVDVLKRDIELRTKQIDLDGKIAENDRFACERETAVASQAIDAKKVTVLAEIEANVKIAQMTSGDDKHKRLARGLVIGAALICATALAITLVVQNKDAVLLELVKCLGLFLGGGGTGYAVGVRRAQKDQTRDSGSHSDDGAKT